MKLRLISAGVWELTGCGMYAHHDDSDGSWKLLDANDQARRWIREQDLHIAQFRTRVELTGTVQALLTVKPISFDDPPRVALRRVRPGLHRTRDGKYEVRRHVTDPGWEIVHTERNWRQPLAVRTLTGAEQLIGFWEITMATSVV